MNEWMMRWCKPVLLTAAVGLLPTAALARDHDDHDRDRRDRVEHRGHVEFHDRWQMRDHVWYRHHGYWREGVWVDVDVLPDTVIVTPPAEDVIVELPPPPPPPPRFEDREVKVWVEPVYRTVIDRVWVPDRWEVRDYVRYEFGFKVVTRKRVLVEPGHYNDIERREVVSPGHYEVHIEHVQVTP